MFLSSEIKRREPKCIQKQNIARSIRTSPLPSASLADTFSGQHSAKSYASVPTAAFSGMMPDCNLRTNLIHEIFLLNLKPL